MEGGREGERGVCEEKEVDGDRVSVPSVLTFPSPSRCKYDNGIG